MLSGSYFALLCIAAFILLQLLPPSAIQALTFERTLLAEGQYWRLITAHFVHLSWLHLLMNSLALALFQWLYGASFPPWRWLAVLPSLCLGISLGLYWGTPGIDWYRGFSGVVIGMLATGALLNLRQQPLFNAAVCATIVAKVLLEQWQGQAVITTAFNSVPTVVDAHLYGATTALCYFGLEAVTRKLNRLIWQTDS